MMPSDGLEFENACQPRKRSRIALRRAGESGIHLPRYSREHVPALVVHHLDALELRVDVQHLAELLLGVAPVLRLHRARSVDDEDDVLAVDRHARDRLVVDLLAALAAAARASPRSSTARVVASVSVSFFSASSSSVLALCLPSTDDRSPRRRARRFCSSVSCSMRARSSRSSTIARPRMSNSSFSHLHDLLLEVLLRLLELDRLAELVQHQQQDDRAEAAADAVEERHAEGLGVAARAPLHGQSFAGLRKPPPVARARRQK